MGARNKRVKREIRAQNRERAHRMTYLKKTYLHSTILVLR